MSTPTQHRAGDIRLPGPEPTYQGKVRDLYDLGDTLLIVASDRVSAYDAVLPTAIPGKGQVLTQLSEFWFEHLAHLGPHHLISTDVAEFPAPFDTFVEQLSERTMWVKRTERVDFECVVRGYLAGSGWREYGRDGTVCGLELPAGLRESERLAEPIFTPALKVDDGHDENVPFALMVDTIGRELATELRDRSLALYEEASRHARERGIIIADTKIEFGVLDGEVLVIDELFTPDSSRFWPADDYEPGRAQHAFDKQFVRDYLDASGWNHEPPAPELPDDVVARTVARYAEAAQRLTAPAS